MLGPGRIGTRGILRGLNQVKWGIVTFPSYYGEVFFKQANTSELKLSLAFSLPVSHLLAF